MASTGTAVFPSTSLFPDTTLFPGQGPTPLLRVLYSTDDASVVNPIWIDGSVKVRLFSISRGRESELGEFEAGTASLTLDNRARTFDSTTHAEIRPLNRWWLFVEFSGEVHDLFKGYAEAVNQGWPDGGWSDSVVTVPCADEFKLLALDGVPTTSPVRNTYEDVIGSDLPAGYWRMNEDPAAFVQVASITEPNPLLHIGVGFWKPPPPGGRGWH